VLLGLLVPMASRAHLELLEQLAHKVLLVLMANLVRPVLRELQGKSVQSVPLVPWVHRALLAYKATTA
jgi:hypothetical protein